MVVCHLLTLSLLFPALPPPLLQVMRVSTALVALVSCLALQAAPCEGVLLGACGRVMLQLVAGVRQET